MILTNVHITSCLHIGFPYLIVSSWEYRLYMSHLGGPPLAPGSPASSLQSGASPEENLLSIAGKRARTHIYKYPFCAEHRHLLNLNLCIPQNAPWENYYPYFVEGDTEAQGGEVNSQSFILLVKAMRQRFDPRSIRLQIPVFTRPAPLHGSNEVEGILEGTNGVGIKSPCRLISKVSAKELWPTHGNLAAKAKHQVREAERRPLEKTEFKISHAVSTWWVNHLPRPILSEKEIHSGSVVLSHVWSAKSPGWEFTDLSQLLGKHSRTWSWASPSTARRKLWA